MNKRLLFLVLLMLSFACGRRERLCNGDLIFVAPQMEADGMDTAIVAATGGSDSLNFTHVAIVEVQGDSVWVIASGVCPVGLWRCFWKIFPNLFLRFGALKAWMLRLRFRGRAPIAAVFTITVFCRTTKTFTAPSWCRNAIWMPPGRLFFPVSP